MQWVSVKDRLPEIDQYVLWLHESGYIFYEAIDKDWDAEYMDYFLGGCGNKETSGPLTHWMPLPKAPVASNNCFNLIRRIQVKLRADKFFMTLVIIVFAVCIAYAVYRILLFM